MQVPITFTKMLIEHLYTERDIINRDPTIIDVRIPA